MVGPSISLPPKREQFMKNLAGDYHIDLDTVVSQLCEWAFSDPESQERFRIWSVEASPAEEEAEEESHEHRD